MIGTGEIVTAMARGSRSPITALNDVSLRSCPDRDDGAADCRTGIEDGPGPLPARHRTGVRERRVELSVPVQVELPVRRASTPSAPRGADPAHRRAGAPVGGWGPFRIGPRAPDRPDP